MDQFILSGNTMMKICALEASPPAPLAKEEGSRIRNESFSFFWVKPVSCGNTMKIYYLIFLAILLVQTGCREAPSEKAPVHLNRNMATQEKYKPQSESRFFADGATMQTPPAGTIARGELREDDAYNRGKLATGAYVDSPVLVTPELLVRGKERYGIYCNVCHGPVGDGRGKIMEYNWPIPPTSYFDPRILAMKDGNIFEVISNGIRNMPSYRQQIPVADRWAIVSYVRVLQRAGTNGGATAQQQPSK
jgi:mono/diheme cytochrome c family protein